MFRAEGVLGANPHVGLVPKHPLHEPDSGVRHEVDDIITIGVPCFRRHEWADGSITPDMFLLIKRPNGRRDDPVAWISVTPVPAHLDLKASAPEDKAIHPVVMAVLRAAFREMPHLACDDAYDALMGDVVQDLAQSYQ